MRPNQPVKGIVGAIMADRCNTVAKYNENHDDRGRFAEGPGGGVIDGHTKPPRADGTAGSVVGLGPWMDGSDDGEVRINVVAAGQIFRNTAGKLHFPLEGKLNASRGDWTIEIHKVDGTVPLREHGAPNMREAKLRLARAWARGVGK